MVMVAAVPMLRLSWISRVLTLGLALINFSTASVFVTVTAVTGVPVLIIETLPASSNFTEPETDLGSQWCILAKKLLKILKGFLLM